MLTRCTRGPGMAGISARPRSIEFSGGAGSLGSAKFTPVALFRVF